jgi:hypothetical protein
MYLNSEVESSPLREVVKLTPYLSWWRRFALPRVATGHEEVFYCKRNSCLRFSKKKKRNSYLRNTTEQQITGALIRIIDLLFLSSSMIQQKKLTPISVVS